MNKARIVLSILVLLVLASSISLPQATTPNWEPITEERLRHPKAGD